MEQKLAERRELTQKLLETKTRKLKLLAEVAEIRTDPEQQVAFDNLLETAKYHSLKTK